MNPSKNNLGIFLLLAVCFLVQGLPAQAQLFGKPNTQVKVYLDQTEVAPGTLVQGTFQMTMNDHWHTYWKYPGDVGLPTEAQWSVPEGWTVSQFQWPAPEFIETAGLVNYAYENEVLLPFTVQVPESAKVGEEVELKVHVSWLECEESCVPGEADLSVAIKVSQESKPSTDSDLIERALAELPKPIEDIKLSIAGSELSISLPSELSGDDIRFFPDSEKQIDGIKPQTVIDQEEGRVLKVQAVEGTESFSGVLTDGTHSFEFASQAQTAAVIEPPAGLGKILVTAAAAFLGGLILNLMPCVFPVLSLKVLGIVEQSKSEGRPAWHHGVVFALGVLISFWVMSGILLAVRAAGQGVGWGYHLQNPLMIGGLAFLFLLIGLNLFGVFEVGESLTQLSGAAEKKEGFAHSFWSGVLTTLAATPCTAPFMGGAVGFALAQPTWVALLIFSALALGVATPYVTFTLFPSLLKALPKPGAWMVTFKQILAFPMLLAVVWLTWVFGSQMGSDRMALFLVALLGVGFASWVYGTWGCSFEPKTQRIGSFFAACFMLLAVYTGYTAAQPQLGEEMWQEYSPELVAQLKAEGKPFFLDFTADWCTSCKANELVALSRSEVIDKFQELEVTLVKADWTKKDPVITQALAEYKRAGVPLYVLYPGEQAEPVLLPEVLLPGTVLEALKNVKK